MGYISNSSVQVSAWVEVTGNSTITYQLCPADDVIEFTLGGGDGLAMQTDEAGLRHCVTVFTSALDAFEAAASQPDPPHSAGLTG